MSNVTTTCRDINELSKPALNAVQLLFQECYKAGIKDIFITETYRSQARQNYLYEQGRTRKYDSKGNKLSVVTWTLKSNHTPRLAWDIACSPPNNLYDHSLLGKVASIAKKLGIDAGYFWKAPNYDAPHFQVASNWTPPKGYKLEGIVTIPTNSKDRIKFVSTTDNQKPTEQGDDDKMKFTNEATKQAVREFVKQSVDHKYIDKSWLDSFDKGKMTNGDLEGLQMIVNNKKANSK